MRCRPFLVNYCKSNDYEYHYYVRQKEFCFRLGTLLVRVSENHENVRFEVLSGLNYFRVIPVLGFYGGRGALSSIESVIRYFKNKPWVKIYM